MERIVPHVCVPLQRFVSTGYGWNWVSASDQCERAIHPFAIKVTSWQLNVPAVWSQPAVMSIKLFTVPLDIFLWASLSPSHKELTFAESYQAVEKQRPYLLLKHCFVWSPSWLTCFMSTKYQGCFDFNDKAVRAVRSFTVNESGSEMWSMSHVYLQELIMMKAVTLMVASGGPFARQVVRLAS